MAELTGLSGIAVRLYRKYSKPTHGAEDEILTLLTGNRAVVIAEAAISESAVLGGDVNLEKSWHEQIEKNGSNVFNQPLTSIATKGAREAVASAIGLSLAGKRATAFVTGQNIGAIQDLLFTASGRHLPLVIHLTNNAMSGHGIAPGSGHEGYHLSCDTGVFTLFAQNAQQAADFTFIARRVAETTLVPGLVAMDAEETALSWQDVNILGPSQVKRLLDASSSELPVPNEAQRLLFGDTRLSVPRWHDVDRPVVTGAAFDSDSYAMGAAGKNVYFEEALVAVLEQTFAEFYKITGRQYGRLTQNKLERAQTVFVAQGAAVETAIAVADSLPDSLPKTGVIGLTCMRPFPAEELASLLNGKANIVVLERLLPAPGAETPLLREFRRLPGSLSSVLHSVRYGIGGAPLRAIDLALVPSSVSKVKTATLHLGMDFEADTLHPKRQVLQDQLKRAYPNVAETGLRSKDGSPDAVVEGTISLAILRSGASGHDQITQNVASILHQVNGGTVRSRPWLSQGAWGEQGSDFLLHSNVDLVDPGDLAALDIVCLTRGSNGKIVAVDADTLQRLRTGGKIIVPEVAGEQLAQMLAPYSAVLEQKSLQLFSIPIPASMAQSDIEEITLGAVLGTIVQSGLATLKERKVFSIRSVALQSLSEENREARVELFKNGFENVSPLDVDSLPSITGDNQAAQNKSAPTALQHLAAKDNQFDSVPRFWDQVGIFYQGGSSERFSPDPYLASGSIAPLSATFRDFSDQRGRFPEIDPEKCTGCGECWTACPDSAIAPVAISPANLIDHGIKVVGGDSLRQLAKQLTSRILSQARIQSLGANAGIVLREAYDWLSEKLDLTPERQEAVEEALDLVCDGVGSLPVSVTDVLFEQAEAKTKDSGELLSLVINPDSCKDCGLCEEVCAEEAILFQIQDEATVSSARQAWNTWMMTPDTSSETIDRVFSSDDVDNMAALNLSRHCLLSMSGGDGGEAGSGEKIAMRMVLAATEYQQQPTITAFSEEIASVIEEIRGEIRKVMALEISDEDLNQLEKSVDDVKSPIIELSDLAKSVEASIGVTPVDTARLSSLLDLTRRLADLQTQLTSGRQGLGRSRFGLAIANGNITSWAAVFPYNAFQSPVTVDFSNETSPMAAGLLEGHLRETCEAIALLRLARLEIEQPPGVEFGKAEITQLTWQDLSEEERQICPPLLIVGDDETLGGAGLAQLLWSLSSDLPIKIISFTDLDLGLQSKADRPQDSRTNTGLMAVACQTAYVAQISIARPDHYQQSVTDAIKYSGPAFVRVHTPSPARHGFESYLTLQQAKFSAQSLAFPLFNYNPELPGVHGTRLDISANDSPSDEEDAPFTIAHWAATEARFSSHFKPTSNADDGVELAEYIGLNERGRKGKSAFITIESGEDKIQLDVDEQLINATEATTNAWQVLQELAGVVTPFTEAVEERIRKQVQTEHEAEIATIRAEYEQQLKDQGDGIRSEVAGKVRSQLVRLVSNAPARSEPAD